MDSTTEISVKKVDHKPLYLICIEMSGGLLMCHSVSKEAFEDACFNTIYTTLFGMFKVSVKYPHWLALKAVRLECHDFIIGTGATHVV